MSKNRFTYQNLYDLIEQTKKDLWQISHPLMDMDRNFTNAEQLAMAYFMASLTIINKLRPGKNILDEIEIIFSEINYKGV